MRLGFVISDKMTMTDVNNRRVLTDTLQSGEMICNVNNYCKIYVLLNCYQHYRLNFKSFSFWLRYSLALSYFY